MKAGATVSVVRVGERNVVADRRCTAPFSVRPCGDRILLASSAAAPVGGDELTLTIDVGDSAQADVGSVAASMVWPGPCGTESSMTTDCAVGPGGHLDIWLEPTISVAESRHVATTTVRLEHDATCLVVEELVLGRHNEASGSLELVLRVERAGRPIIHHHEVFGPAAPGALSSVSVGAARFVLSAVAVGVDPGEPRTTIAPDCAVSWMPVADDAVVVMAVGHDRPSVMKNVGGLDSLRKSSAVIGR